jgi:hypothetical protein
MSGFMPFAFQYEQQQQQMLSHKTGKLSVFNSRLHLSSSTEDAHEIIQKESSILVGIKKIKNSIYCFVCSKRKKKRSLNILHFFLLFFFWFSLFFD